MTGIDLLLLGGFEVKGPSGALLSVTPRKVRALLAYLGAHVGKAVSRAQLSSLFWGDISADEQARRSLRQALTTLRRELPPDTLDTRRDEIVLRPIAVVDVSQFEHVARQPDRRSLERALQLYRGELLDGVVAHSSGFDAWLERERKRLQTLAIDVMQRLCVVQRGEGDATAAMATAMRLVATDPLREAGQRVLMELYAEAGRASEAVRQFQTLRALLQEKLGTAPDAQTSELYERIRRASERRTATLPSRSPLVTAELPELRQACILAIWPGESALDSRLERDIEIVLARFGGSLMRVEEGRALGVFGYPRAHDDDIERGVRAALSLFELEPMAAKATIGAASGQVCIENRADGPVVRGDVLSSATKLVECERPGVFVSASIATAMGERLVWTMAEADGRARRALRCLAGSELGGRTPLVGRRHEVAQLSGTLALCRETGRGRTVVIKGDAGIGKTRLARAVSQLALEQGFSVHVRSIVDFGDQASVEPLQSVVRELLAESLPAGTRSEVVEPLDESDSSLLLDMVREVATPSAGHDAGGRDLYLSRRRNAACRLVALRSSETPRLIWMDDVHWADAEGLAQLAAWADVAARHPLVLLLTTRHTEMSEPGSFSGVMRGKAVTTLDLAPLTEEEARELVAALGTEDPSRGEMALRRADGNPLFIEQLLRFPVPGCVPPGISSLVQARCDKLPPEARALLQAASVLGHRFTRSALSQVLEVDDPSLITLLAESLVIEHAEGYAFVHDLVRNAVYDSLPLERRVRLHENAARHYAGRDAALHAEHLDRAKHEGAAAAYVVAARSELRAGKLERAYELCLRGQDLAERARDRYASLLLLGELSIELGRAETALDAFARARSSASDAAERARTHVGRAAALRLLDRSKEALLELANAEHETDPQREPALLSRIHYLRGNVLFPLGNWDACLDSQTRALETARRTGSTLAEARALSGMADAHVMAGRWRTARACFLRCEGVSRQVGALDLELTSRGMAHLLDALDLSFTASAAGCQEVAERSRVSGLQRAEAVARLSAAWALLAMGEWQTALTEARRGTTLADEMGAKRFGALGIAYTAIAQARLGEREAARAELPRALTLARSSSLWFSGPAVYAAELATAADDRLLPLLDEIDEIVESGCMNLSLITLFPHAMEAALKIGDPSRAARYAEFLERSMQEEPHTLGAVLVDVARTLTGFHADPALASLREKVRQQLDDAGMRPARALLDLPDLPPGSRAAPC